MMMKRWNLAVLSCSFITCIFSALCPSTHTWIFIKRGFFFAFWPFVNTQTKFQVTETRSFVMQREKPHFKAYLGKTCKRVSLLYRVSYHSVSHSLVTDIRSGMVHKMHGLVRFTVLGSKFSVRQGICCCCCFFFFKPSRNTIYQLKLYSPIIHHLQFLKNLLFSRTCHEKNEKNEAV